MYMYDVTMTSHTHLLMCLYVWQCLCLFVCLSVSVTSSDWLNRTLSGLITNALASRDTRLCLEPGTDRPGPVRPGC